MTSRRTAPAKNGIDFEKERSFALSRSGRLYKFHLMAEGRVDMACCARKRIPLHANNRLTGVPLLDVTLSHLSSRGVEGCRLDGVLLDMIVALLDWALFQLCHCVKASTGSQSDLIHVDDPSYVTSST